MFDMKRLLSGIRISGVTHIGNYFGALKQWVEMQDEYESFAFLADLHALTTPEEAKDIQAKTVETAKIYLACGLNPEHTTIFVQSHIPAHTELSWILGTIASMGELQRMTQFKEKSEGKKSVNLGLFAYPVLMASDILLYQPEVVPVGEDQKQHVELTRDLAQRLNSKYGDVFRVPNVQTPKVGARIMGLDDASKKMSKSATSAYNYISLLDDADTIKKKIKSAVTDSGNEIVFDEKNKPAISNLLTIYSLTTGKSIKESEKEFEGQSYGTFKEALAEALISLLEPIQKKYTGITDSEAKSVLKQGAEKAKIVANDTLNKVKSRIGLLLP